MELTVMTTQTQGTMPFNQWIYMSQIPCQISSVRTAIGPKTCSGGICTLNISTEDTTNSQRQQQRERHQTKVLMSKTMVVLVRYKSAPMMSYGVIIRALFERRKREDHEKGGCVCVLSFFYLVLNLLSRNNIMTCLHGNLLK